MSSMSLSRIFGIAVLLVTIISGCAKGGNDSNSPIASQSTDSPSASASESANSSPTPSNAPPEVKPTEGSEAGIDPSPLPSSSSAPADEQASMGEVTALRLADFKTGWAGGIGWIAKTEDGGKTWSTQLQHQYRVNQLFALNDKLVWATLDIGDSKSMQLLHSTDGGKNWAEAGSVPNWGFLHFVSAKEAFSGNARTIDGGKTWSRLTVPDTIVGDAYFHDRSNGWAVTQGNDNFDFLRTTDGGKTWHSLKTLATTAAVSHTVIRSTGKDDAWIELIGGSGMTQTSYSIFHTLDGGKSWQPVLANSGAGSGPAPGYVMDKETKVPVNSGNSPGTLYVVNPQIAFMGGQCQACDDNTNTMGKTTDGGKTWINQKAAFPGYGPQQIAAADASHIWWINTSHSEPSVMYTSSDGGSHWNKVHTFDKPIPIE